MIENSYLIETIGVIVSQLKNLADAPLQGDEGSYAAWIELRPDMALGLTGVKVGDPLMLLTWLHQAQRDVLQVHPRGNLDTPLTGVFATRSPHRPNPIGLHEVSVLEIDGHRLKVAPLEAIDGTPIVDIKPVLGQIKER
jgi:tRNA-Thr(GGU) m(6)t(6)A37 methyltransferase TsaA